MAEVKKETALPKTPEPEPAPALTSAAASSDPAVHQMLGEIQSARMNRAMLDPSAESVAGADAALAAAEKALADAGYC